MQRAEDVGPLVAPLQAELHRLGPVRVPVPALIRTAHAFHAVPLAELRKATGRWSREHRAVPPEVLLEVAERLWFSGSREAMIVATMLLEKRRDAREVLDAHRIERWATKFDGWELVDNLGMAVVATWVAENPGDRFGVLESMALSPRAWSRRLALVGTLDMAAGPHAGEYWPRVRDLCEGLARDREASIPKAISWVLRTYGRHIPDAVALAVRDEGTPLPALARRETLHFLEFGRKRGPRAK